MNQTNDPFESLNSPPPAPREFRGAWIASVNNIDWPSRPGLPAETQRAEAIAKSCAVHRRARRVGPVRG